MPETTDTEFIASAMESRPSMSPGEWDEESTFRPDWWQPSDEKGGEWQPEPLTLDALQLVESVLTDSQWSHYHALLLISTFVDGQPKWRGLIHATAEQKIAALATVIREAMPK